MNVPSLKLVATAALMLTMVGCTPMHSDTSGRDAESAADELAQNTTALETYVEAERATIPQLMDSMPGTYSDVTIDGDIRESTGRGELIPDVMYAVMHYSYTYAEPMDYSSTKAGLEQLQPTLEEACDSVVFPAMRSAGVTMQKSAIYTWGDRDGAISTYTCVEG
ncbi:hypothetical protein ACDF64_16480 [Agromyces sp. MMS24-JH15]|uniref:hypothetical protein n=1 Tax=Agromyces sp. MMS24-JH15 TaxID=3243765 RepID=UPI003749E51E